MAKKTRVQPEIICLSDDEEDNSSNSTISPLVTPIKSAASKSEKSEDSTNSSQSTEPIVHKKDIIRIPDLTIKRTDLLKKPLQVHCSKIYFGLIEFNVESNSILLKETEFEFKLKSTAMENLTIRLAYTDIIAFYFSFQSQPAVGFIQVRSDFGELFDKYIPCTDEHGRKFDPNSKDVRRRRIIISLERLTGESEQKMLSSVYFYLKQKCPTMSVCCITTNRAEELYNQSRSDRGSTINSNVPPFYLKEKDLTPRTVGLNRNSIRFELSSEDLKCLNEGEFLNDNIIDFYLQYIFYEKLSEEDRERTYLFNSFFYTRLTRKGNDDLSNISAAERRYNRVKRWLRDVDIFSKDYLIVPINQTAHWFIVLIQFHDEVSTEADLISDDEDEINDQTMIKRKKTQGRSIDFNGENESPTVEETVERMEIVDQNCNKTLKISKDSSQTPGIILFDSLRTGSKTRVFATLREFLQLEFDHKKTLPVGSLQRKIFNVDTIGAIEAAVPQQPNYFDCGLYILQYIESFFAHRSAKIDFRSTATFADWCESTTMGSWKRKQIFDVINQCTIVKEEC